MIVIVYTPPSRWENKSQRLYRINEEIYYAKARIQEARRTGNLYEIETQTRRIELLNELKQD